MKAPITPIKDCHFVGSSRRDLKKFPEDVQGAVGHAFHEVQVGLEPLSAKALQGFTGRSVLEVIEDYDGDTYRAVYTVRFPENVYVRHCFQKKSKRGIATPKHDIDIIKTRLQAAQVHHQAKIRQKDKDEH